MALRLHSVTFDCADPAALSSFWAAVTGYHVQTTNPFFAELRPAGPDDAGPDGGGPGDRGRDGSDFGPRMMFIQVPEAKASKNRVHLDLGTDDLEAEVERMLGLGAELVGRYDEWGAVWVTFRDPGGNEFCVGHHPMAEPV